MLRPNKWWRGLWVVLPLIVAAATAATPKIERGLADRTERAVVSAGLLAPRLTVSGRDVAISGLAADRDRPVIAAAATATPGLRIAATTPLELPPGDRWTWSLTRDGSSVEFAGRVGSRAAAVAAAADIRRGDPTLVVLDRAVPTGAAPRDDDAMVRFASEQISRLSPGAVRFDGVGLVVSGNPTSRAAAVALRDAVRATPTAWNVHLDDATSRMVASIVAGRAVAGLTPPPVAADPKPAVPTRVTALPAATARPATPPAIRAAARLQSLAPARGTIDTAPVAARAGLSDPRVAPAIFVAPILPALRIAEGPVPTAAPAATASLATEADHAAAPRIEAKQPAAETRIGAADTVRPVAVAMAIDRGPTSLGPSVSDAPPPLDRIAAGRTDTRDGACGFVAGTALPQVPLFASGSTRLDRDARTKLGAIARTLASCPDLRIAVHGHADPHGDALTNERLARDRAAHVSQWLARHGVDAGRLTWEGFGADRPSSATDRAGDRRVEVRIL